MRDNINGHQYEYECAKRLKQHGFARVTVTKGSGDQGIDVIAYGNGKKYGIQCKYYSSPVGNSAVQEAYAGAKYYDCDVAVVMTNNIFTKSAIELSKTTGVLLWANNTIAFKYPLYAHILKFVGLIIVLFGLLTVWTTFSFEEIPYRFIQQIQSIVILSSGILTILQSRFPKTGMLSTPSHLVSFTLSLIIGLLCNNVFNKTAFIFLCLALLTFTCMIISKRTSLKSQ